MKRKTIVLSILSFLALTSCEAFPSSSGGNINPPTPPEEVVHVKSISIEAENTTLVVGDRTSYNVTVLPTNADEEGYDIISSDESIVRVDPLYLTGLKKGTATITVTSFDGDLTSTLEMTVINEEDIDKTVHVSSIALNYTKNTLYIDETMTYSVTVLPDNADNKEYEVTSSNSSIISIENNTLKGLKAGEANITVTSKDNGVSDTVQFTVLTPGADRFAGYAPEEYTLEWEDEFNGNSLSDNWEPMIGNGSRYGIRGWGNAEQEYYTDRNATVSNGLLHIVAKRESVHDEDEGDFKFTSARLRTTGKITTTYGYIESRMKLPEGTGLWPAFWMLPEERFNNRGWPTSGEIDIMEARGRLPDRFGSTLHSANSSNADVYHGKDYVFENDDITNYHCYAVEWLPEVFNFYIDGYMFFSCPNTIYQNNNNNYKEVSSSAPFDRPFHILLNFAIGGNYDGGKTVSSDFKSAEMTVDYVRIFKK